MSLDIGASRCKWKYHLAGKKDCPSCIIFRPFEFRHFQDDIPVGLQRDHLSAPYCVALQHDSHVDDRDRVIDGDYGSGRLAG